MTIRYAWVTIKRESTFKLEYSYHPEDYGKSATSTTVPEEVEQEAKQKAENDDRAMDAQDECFEVEDSGVVSLGGLDDSDPIEMRRPQGWVARSIIYIIEKELKWRDPLVIAGTASSGSLSASGDGLFIERRVIIGDTPMRIEQPIEVKTICMNSGDPSVHLEEGISSMFLRLGVRGERTADLSNESFKAMLALMFGWEAEGRAAAE